MPTILTNTFALRAVRVAYDLFMSESLNHGEFDQELLYSMNVEARWFVRPNKSKNIVTIEDWHRRVVGFLRETASPAVARQVDMRSLVTRHACHIVLSESMYLHQVPFTMNCLKGDESMDSHFAASDDRLQKHFETIAVNRGFNVMTRTHPLFGNYKGASGINEEGRDVWKFRDLPRHQTDFARALAQDRTLQKVFAAFPELRELDPSVRVTIFFKDMRAKVYDLLKGVTAFTPKLRADAEGIIVEEWIKAIAPLQKSIEALGREHDFDDLFHNAGQLEDFIQKTDVSALSLEEMKKMEHVFAFACMQYMADGKRDTLHAFTEKWVGRLLENKDPACEHPFVGLAMFAACVQEPLNDPKDILRRA